VPEEGLEDAQEGVRIHGDGENKNTDKRVFLTPSAPASQAS
jgi:hypothetical protein